MADTTQALLTQALDHPIPYIRARAQIILLTLAEKPLEEIANLAEVTPATVTKWQGEWAKKGMAIFPDDVRNATLNTPPPLPEPAIKSEPAETTEIQATATTKDAAEPVESDEITAQDTLAEAIRKIFRTRLVAMQTHEAIALVGEDIEGVHQMRVAIRQMRSVYDLVDKQVPPKFRKKRIRKPMTKTAEILGNVRDWDVILADMGQINDATLDPLRELVAEEQRRAHKALRKWLKGKDYAEFASDFKRLLRKPSKPHGETLTTLASRLVMEHLQTIYGYDDRLENATLATLHLLRIEFKRLRYLLEFFEPVMGSEGEKVVKICKKMQDHLGALNDTAVALQHLTPLLDDLPPDNREASRNYLATRQTEQNDLLAKFPKQWAKFMDEAKPLTNN